MSRPSHQPLRFALPAWIALVAFVFGLFAPALSHAFVPKQLPGHASQICTAAGMVMVPVAGDPSQDAGAVPDMTHCDLCCSTASPALLPDRPTLPPLVIQGRDTHPPLFYQSPSPQFAWTPAQSRAPPASLS